MKLSGVASNMAVLIFAGIGRKDRELWAGVSNFNGKAHIMVADRTMLDWVKISIRSAGLAVTAVIGEWIIGDTVSLSGYKLLAGTGSLAGNLWKMVRSTKSEVNNLLLVSCDIPDVQDGLAKFVDEARDTRGVAVGIIDSRICSNAYHGAKPTSLWIQGVPYTLCNAIIVRKQVLLDNAELVELMIGKKKSKCKLALVVARVAPWVAFKAMTSFLTKGKFLRLEELTGAFTKLLKGAEARVVISNDPGFGFDGDDPEKCRILDRAMRQRLQIAT